MKVMLIPNEVMEQFETVRKSALFNMFDFYGVQREAFDREFYAFVNFTENNSEQYHKILDYYNVWILGDN